MKVQENDLQRYEILFIIANNYTEEEARNINEKIENLLTENEAQIVFKEFWGKKKLAYPIKHNFYGYYSLIEFNINPKFIKKLNELIRLNHEILRHLIVSVPALSDAEREEVKEKQAKFAKTKLDNSGKYVIDNKDKADQKINSKNKASDEEIEEKSKQAKDDSSNSDEPKKELKIEEKDLDEKLNDIISAQNLL